MIEFIVACIQYYKVHPTILLVDAFQYQERYNSVRSSFAQRSLTVQVGSRTLQGLYEVMIKRYTVIHTYTVNDIKMQFA